MMKIKKIAVSAIIRNSQGELLLQYRNKGKYIDRWVLFGGHMLAGENYEQALRRELLEEIELKVNKLKFFDTYEDDAAITPIYIVEEAVEIRQLVLHEGQGMRFFKPEELKDIDIGYNQRKILMDFLDR
jgi:8-oxo-dGTP diphosphatase